MPILKLEGTIMQVGSGRAIYLPKWFCEQLNVQAGQGFTLKTDEDASNRLQVSLDAIKKSLDKR